MRRLLTSAALLLVVCACSRQPNTRNLRPPPTIDTLPPPPLPLLINRVGPVDTIIGVVSDARTSAGIENARVLDVSAQRVTMTDRLGRFQLAAGTPGKVVLRTSGVGYRSRVDTVDVVARQGLSLGIPMRPDAVRLAYTCSCPMVIFLQVDIRSSVPTKPIPYAIVTTTQKNAAAKRDSVPASAFVDTTMTKSIRIPVDGTPTTPVTVEISAPGFKPYRTQVKELPHSVTAVLAPT